MSSSEPAWKRSEVRFIAPKIIIWYKWKIFQQIGQTLNSIGGAALVDQFTSGCFRRLFFWQPGNSPSRALHVLFSYEMESPNPDELWFHVEGNQFRFCAQHYALVSGLCFGYSTFDPSRGPHDLSGVGVYHRVAGGKPIQLRALKRNFIASRLYTVDHSEQHDDYLKVANILALYCFFLGYDDSRKIEDWAWLLVDDLVAWNRFPWGAYTYGALMHYAARIPTTVNEAHKQYHVYGPMWALQVWSFETIPGLGAGVGSFIQPNNIPRAMRWRFGAPGDVNFGHIFGEDFLNVEMTVSSLEAEQDYWTSTLEVGLFGVRFFTADNPIQPRRVQDGKPVLFRKARELEKSTGHLRRSKNASKVIEDEDEESIRQAEMQTRAIGNSTAEGSSSRLQDRGDWGSDEVYQRFRSGIRDDIHSEMESYVVPTLIKGMKSWMKSFFRSSKRKSRRSKDREPFSRMGAPAQHSVSVPNDPLHRSLDREQFRHDVSGHNDGSRHPDRVCDKQLINFFI